MGRSTVKAAAMVVLALTLTGCATNVGMARLVGSSPLAVGHADYEPDPIPSVAILGDSTTSWDPPYDYQPGLSWVTTAAETLPIACGGAESGATVARMLETAQYCPQARFLLFMGGTNDIPPETPIPERLATVDAIVDKVAAKYVAILLVAPLDRFGPAVMEWNAALTAHANERGWLVLDPWASVRSETGTYLPGTAYYDGVHPTPDTAAVVGAYIAETISLVSRFLP